MGVNPTQPNYKSFTFDGTNSRAYGVYITGQGVFNAPLRNVEMVEIPGRDGAYALDKGNFNNIEVTYPAGIFADNETDFATAVSNLRNFLCSKVGYVRLEDDYNPNEYRMAVYKSGLDVTHDMLIAGEFEITFECKPQRWLTSGETKTTLTSGNTITNPTLFDAKPQLQTKGYGEISIGSQVITVENVPYGTIIISSEESGGTPFTPTSIQFDLMNNGDNFVVSGARTDVIHPVKSGYQGAGLSVTSTTLCSATSLINGERFVADDITFTKGTSSTTTCSATYTLRTKQQGSSTTVGVNVTVTFTIAYNGTDTLTYSVSVSPSSIGGREAAVIKITSPQIQADSSASALGNPLYIDLDVGEAYNLDNGTAVSANNAVTLPTELPILPSGNTTITFDNTFTKVDIVPRWWKV